MIQNYNYIKYLFVGTVLTLMAEVKKNVSYARIDTLNRMKLP